MDKQEALNKQEALDKIRKTIMQHKGLPLEVHKEILLKAYENALKKFYQKK